MAGTFKALYRQFGSNASVVDLSPLQYSVKKTATGVVIFVSMPRMMMMKVATADWLGV